MVIIIINPIIIVKERHREKQGSSTGTYCEIFMYYMTDIHMDKCIY